MPRSRFALGFGRVNLIKKVKVDGEWKFCPAIVDPGRRLTDKVLVKGKTETHSEGTYYIEWREEGGRRREAVHSRALVFEQARLKALELEGHANRSEEPPPQASQDSDASAAQPTSTPLVSYRPSLLGTAPLLVETSAASLIWKGIESYFQQIIGAAVRSELQGLGLVPQPPSTQIKPAILNQAAICPNQQETRKSTSANGGVLIADAIDSYLKDVEPPQREQKTYDEYLLVLYKFRDTCAKRHIHEIDRDDLLEFRRQLYAIGNEARTVFNRMGIVLQLLKLHGIERLLKKGDKPK